MPNNSQITHNGLNLEEARDITPWLHQQENELSVIIEALTHINSSSYWKVLSQKVFDGASDILQKKLEEEKDDKEIYRLQGRIAERKSLNLGKLVEIYKGQLSNVRQQIKNAKK